MYSVFPTGVTRYEPERAHNNYILFDGRDGQTHLIDMNGNDVHTWVVCLNSADNSIAP